MKRIKISGTKHCKILQEDLKLKTQMSYGVKQVFKTTSFFYTIKDINIFKELSEVKNVSGWN